MQEVRRVSDNPVRLGVSSETPWECWPKPDGRLNATKSHCLGKPLKLAGWYDEKVRLVVFMLSSLIFGALLVVSPVLQEKSFKVGGAILYEDRKPVEHAKVTLKGLEKKVSSELITEADGKYEFGDLPAGRYSIEVRLHGYDAIIREFSLGLRPVYRLFFEFRRTDEKAIPLTEIVAERESSRDQPSQPPLPPPTDPDAAPGYGRSAERTPVASSDPLPEPESKVTPKEEEPSPAVASEPAASAPTETHRDDPEPEVPAQVVVQPEPVQPPGQALAQELTFVDALSLRDWLATLGNNHLTSIVALEPGRSLFIVQPAIAAPEYALYRASRPEVLGPAISSRLTERPEERFVGVHFLADGRCVLVFRKPAP